MDEQITIVEGPPPQFQTVEDGWPLGLNESPTLARLAVTHLRTFNGPALVERCYRAWNHQQVIHLEYRQSDGLETRAPIVAARNLETPDGHMLILWVRLGEETELEMGYEDGNENGQDGPET